MVFYLHQIEYLQSMLNVRPDCLPLNKSDTFLFILDPPIVNVNNDLIQSERHENVSIECRALSRPFARITWQKNGKMIDEMKSSNTRLNQTMSISRLTIQVRRNQDSIHSQITSKFE